MSESEIRKRYVKWRKENHHRKPDRAIVRMYWEDGDNTDKGYQVDTIHLRTYDGDNIPKDDALILYYVSGLKGLLSLTKPGNGRGFVVSDVLEFYKSTK